MEDLVTIERMIQDLAGSKDLPTGVATLQKATELHAARAQALKDEAEKLMAESAREKYAAEALEVALKVLGQIGQPATSSDISGRALSTPFARMSARECAEIVLREIGHPMTATELAEEVGRRGKDLGTQPSATVINALKRYAERHETFYREATERGFVYGLGEWQEEKKTRD